MRLIDADAMMDDINTSINEMTNIGIAVDVDWLWAKLNDAIENVPTIEERKTGRWILHENQRQEDVDNGNYLYICSECGKSDLHAKTQRVPFCWWCGAKMEEKHDS